jgi:hypothetical protein
MRWRSSRRGIRGRAPQEPFEQLHDADRNDYQGPTTGESQNASLLQGEQDTYGDQQDWSTRSLSEQRSTVIHGGFPSSHSGPLPGRASGMTADRSTAARREAVTCWGR